MVKNMRYYLSAALIISLVAVATILVITIPLAVVFSQESSQESENDAFKLHVNPADPVIMSVETLEGDIIYLLGNKTSDGLPQSVNEFHVESEEGSTYVRIDADGPISSAVNSDGLQMDFIWSENSTVVHISLVLGNGSEQVNVNVDLSEPVDDIFTDFEDNAGQRKRRSVKNSPYENHEVHTKSKRMSGNQDFATATIFAESCEMPESDARVFADVLTDYDADSGNYEDAMTYRAVQGQAPGQYHVRIPTSRASDIGDKTGKICDKIEMILGDICGYYSNLNDAVSLFSKHKVDSLICFGLGRGLQLAFPLLRVVPIYRFCKTAFKGLDKYCDYANKDLGGGNTPASLLCDALPFVDNGIDIFRQQDILFTPSAFFPEGNRVIGSARVLSLSPGSSTVAEAFTIVNDRSKLAITDFTVTPFDPAPDQDYFVWVTYQCFGTDLRVDMSIIGTDEYADQVTCHNTPSCLLVVPGAEALVEDTVTIVVQDTFSRIERRVVVIF